MCTNFHLVAKDKSVVVGRAMDFTRLFSPFFLIRKKGRSMPIGYDDGFLVYSKSTTKYGYVGIGVDDLIPGVSEYVTTDGMNEVGLSAGFLYLRGTKYQKLDKENPDNNILIPFFCDWLLGNCKDIDDVKNIAPTFKVGLPFSNTESMEELEELVPLYVAVVDSSGKSIVIEFLNGEMVITDNPVGVSTNEPPINWHFQNLDLYQNFSFYDPEAFRVGKLLCEPFEYSGLIGMPGDMTSPSRFIRVAYAREFARKAETSDDAYNIATHLLNMVDAPAGLTRFDNVGEGDSHQRWCAVKGLTSGVFAVRSYFQMNYVALNLKEIDFENTDNITMKVPEVPLFNFISPDV